MSQYSRGTRFEHDVRELLRECGYTVVRSAGSKTKIDLIAWKFGEILFIQCKAGTTPVGSAEWNQVFSAGRCVPGARPVIAHKKPGLRKPLFWLLIQPRLPNARTLRNVHWEDWTPDTVGDSHAR